VISGLENARLAWGSAVERSARELLDGDRTRLPESEARDAGDWLRNLLTNGPLTRKEVQAQANDAGLMWHTVQRAMRSAGVESHRGGFGMPATWSIRANPTHSSQLRQPQRVGANEGEFGGTDVEAEPFDV